MLLFASHKVPLDSDCGGGTCMELMASVVVIHLVADKTWARTRTAHICCRALSILRFAFHQSPAPNRGLLP
jgi:hypothetical protein